MITPNIQIMISNFVRIPGWGGTLGANLLRRLLAVACVAILWIGVQPNAGHAQLPRLEAIAESKETVSPYGLAIQDQPALDPSVFDDTWRGAFRRFFCDGEWYFSWGFSRESWAPTNIHVSQPSQGNNFTIYNVHGIDDPSWTSLFSAQYNIRVGRFVDEARTLAVEFSLDHTKYTSVIGQTARLAGTIAGKPTDANYRLDESFFSYNLHNGANHVMINLVKRVPLIGEPNERFSVAAIGKVGIGMMVPHSQNTILGQYNDVGRKEFSNLIGTHSGWWQIDGWTTGVELGFRVGLSKHLYLELTDKIAFARLGDIPVYQGTASHNLWMNEVILSVGFTFGGR